MELRKGLKLKLACVFKVQSVWYFTFASLYALLTVSWPFPPKLDPSLNLYATKQTTAGRDKS